MPAPLGRSAAGFASPARRRTQTVGTDPLRAASRRMPAHGAMISARAAVGRGCVLGADQDAGPCGSGSVVAELVGGGDRFAGCGRVVWRRVTSGWTLGGLPDEHDLCQSLACV